VADPPVGILEEGEISFVLFGGHHDQNGMDFGFQDYGVGDVIVTVNLLTCELISRESKRSTPRNFTFTTEGCRRFSRLKEDESGSYLSGGDPTTAIEPWIYLGDPRLVVGSPFQNTRDRSTATRVKREKGEVAASRVWFEPKSMMETVGQIRRNFGPRVLTSGEETRFNEVRTPRNGGKKERICQREKGEVQVGTPKVRRRSH